MRTFPKQGQFFFALLLLIGVAVTTADTDIASCTNYTKGEFGPQTINDKPVCQNACQVAEGLPVGRFDSAFEYAKCTCINEDSSGMTTDTRDLCQDGEPLTSGGSSLVRSAALLAAMAIVASVV